MSLLRPAGRLLCLALLLTTVACSLSTPAAAPTATTPQTPPTATPRRTEQLPIGKLALGRQGAILIWQDRQLQQIVPPPATQPALSPDGTMLAYIERSSGAGDLILADSNGNRLQQLTTNGSNMPDTSLDRVFETAWAFYPAWAPNGERIVAAMQAQPPAGDPPNDPALNLFDIGLFGDRLQLTDVRGLDFGRSAVASNGMIFVAAAARDVDEQQLLYAIDPAGTRTLLSQVPVPAYDPTLSRDERYLLFSATVNGRTDIYALDLLNSSAAPVQLTQFGTARAAAVSPDGRSMAFLAVADGAAVFDLYIAELGVDQEGVLRAQNPRRLSTEFGFDPDAGLSWAP